MVFETRTAERSESGEGAIALSPSGAVAGEPGGAMAPPEKNLSDDFDACRKF